VHALKCGIHTALWCNWPDKKCPWKMHANIKTTFQTESKQRLCSRRCSLRAKRFVR